MDHIKSAFYLRTCFCLVMMFFAIGSVVGQTSRQEKMEQLNFMIGEWVGISTAYQNDTIVKQVPAMEKISYRLDKNLITIDLQSETLKLHTVIYYDDKDEKYYYNSYYKEGTGKYPAEYKDGKFIVSPNKSKRFIFHLTPKGNFQEYGEKFENGEWIKYFEDNFKKSIEN